MAVRADKQFQAFAERARLRILALLQDGEMCVCDIVAVLKIPQPTASRHLGYLRKAGLVTGRKKKLWMFYSLKPPAGPLHENLLKALGASALLDPELRADVARGRKLLEKGCCATSLDRNGMS